MWNMFFSDFFPFFFSNSATASKILTTNLVVLIPKGGVKTLVLVTKYHIWSVEWIL